MLVFLKSREERLGSIERHAAPPLPKLRSYGRESAPQLCSRYGGRCQLLGVRIWVLAWSLRNPRNQRS
jgi:hypothetical protein